MTHKDIYIKFMIEYDKTNVTSSYPSLTEYEVATVLDKAYNALIAQKVTGNNVRRAPFEADIKSISDIAPLVTTEKKNVSLPGDAPRHPNNVALCDIPDGMLYYVSSFLMVDGIPAEVSKRKDNFQDISDSYSNENGEETPVGSRPILDFDNLYHNPIDGEYTRILPAKLVSHEIASKFFANAHNIPWIKDPVCYIEDKYIYFVYDPIDTPLTGNSKCSITFIKKPNTFVKDLTVPNSGWVSYFDWGSGDAPDEYMFEGNDTVAEELISLAVAFALENVESQRLNSKLNMRGLEA